MEYTEVPVTSTVTSASSSKSAAKKSSVKSSTEDHLYKPFGTGFLMECTVVPVTSTGTSALSSKSTAKKLSVESSTATSESNSKSTAKKSSVKSSTATSAPNSKSAAKKKSVKSSTATSAPNSKSTAKKSSVKSMTKDPLYHPFVSSLRNTIDNSSLQVINKNLYQRVLPEIQDSSQKASNSFKNGSVVGNKMATLVEPPPFISNMDNITLPSRNGDYPNVFPGIPDYSQKASISFKTGSVVGNKMDTRVEPRPFISSMHNITLPSRNVDYRYVFPGIQAYSQKASNSFKTGSVVGNKMTTRVEPTPSISSMDNRTLPSKNVDYRYVLPGIQDYSQKASNSFKTGSVVGNKMTKRVDPTQSISSMDNSTLPSRNEDYRYVLPEIKLQPEILDYCKKASISFKTGSGVGNKMATRVEPPPFISSMDNSTLPSSTNRPITRDLYRCVWPEENAQPRILDCNKKESNSFKTVSVLEDMLVTRVAPTASSSSNTMDNSSLQSSTKHTTSQGIAFKSFKTKILYTDNSVNNSDPIRTGPLIENTAVACTGPVATSSKSTVGGSYYFLSGDGKLSVVVTNKDGKPTSQIRFRSDGTPDERVYPLNSTQNLQPDTVHVRGYIDQVFNDAGTLNTRYLLHTESCMKVRIAVQKLEKISESKLVKALLPSSRDNTTDIPPNDRLRDYIQDSRDILHQLEEDLSKLIEVFQYLNDDRHQLEQKLSSMQNAQMSFAETADVYNALNVMTLFVKRGERLLKTSSDRKSHFYSIQDKMNIMLKPI